MEHKIKALAEAMTHAKTKKLIQSHTKELRFENNHLTIFLDNAAPLHELSLPGMDKHLKSGLEKVYGKDITYELKLYSGKIPHEREKEVGRDIWRDSGYGKQP